MFWRIGGLGPTNCELCCLKWFVVQNISLQDNNRACQSSDEPRPHPSDVVFDRLRHVIYWCSTYTNSFYSSNFHCIRLYAVKAGRKPFWSRRNNRKRTPQPVVNSALSEKQLTATCDSVKETPLPNDQLLLQLWVTYVETSK